MFKENAPALIKKNLLVFLALLFFLAAVFIHNRSARPEIKVTKQDSTYTLSSTFIKLISLGNKRVFSNSFWIMTLMESDQEKYKKNDFADWMYIRFFTIATLDPLFYENYLYGGMYLSTIKDDLAGAATIFDLGLKYYPKDYRLNYYSGFNYFYEMGDFKKGYERLKVIQYHPKLPPNLKGVIAKLKFEVTGDYNVAFEFLKETWQLTKDEYIKKKLEGDMYAVIAQRDLECLNEGNKECSRRDLHGRPYVKDSSGKWKSELEFKPYKIFRPEFIESVHPSKN